MSAASAVDGRGGSHAHHPSPTSRAEGVVPPRRSLHGLESLADLDARAALQDRALLREPHRGVEIGRLDDAVTADRVRAATWGDLALGVDRARLPDGVATVDEILAELLHPLTPGRHDLGLLFLGLRHLAAVIREQVCGHCYASLECEDRAVASGLHWVRRSASALLD